MRTLIALSLLASALSACAAPPTRVPAASVSAQPSLGQPFTLTIGQNAILDDARLTITFDAVTEDSRCPKQVVCVWAGRAVLAISVRKDHDAPTQLSVSTIAAGDKVNQVAFDNYIIELKEVQPYPETPDRPINPDEYHATFVVQRLSP